MALSNVKKLKGTSIYGSASYIALTLPLVDTRLAVSFFSQFSGIHAKLS